MNKVTNIHEDNKVTSFDNLWFLCKIEEDKLGTKVLKVKGLKHLREGKGSWENLFLRKRKKRITDIQCYGYKL